MRYFEIVKPTTMHILSDTDLKEPTWGKPRIDEMESAGSCQTGTAILPGRKTLSGSHVGSIYSPAFAIAQASPRPRNRSQPTLSSRVRQTIADACCQSKSDGSSGVAIVTTALQSSER